MMAHSRHKVVNTRKAERMSTRLHVRLQSKWDYTQGAGRRSWRHNACRAILDKARCLLHCAHCIIVRVISWHQALQPPCRSMCSSLAVAAASTL